MMRDNEFGNLVIYFTLILLQILIFRNMYIHQIVAIMRLFHKVNITVQYFMVSILYPWVIVRGIKGLPGQIEKNRHRIIHTVKGKPQKCIFLVAWPSPF